MNVSYYHCAKTLLITDYKTICRNLGHKVINLSIRTICYVFVNAYLLTDFGVTEKFGVITLGAVLAITGIFEGYNSIAMLVRDLESEKITYYYATLPLPSWLVFFRIMISNALLYMVLSISIFPLGKLLLWNTLELGSVNWFHLVITLFTANFFYGALVLFAASWAKGLSALDNAWSRLIFPLWFLGGFNFSWYSLYKTSPSLAMLDLMNPVIYITESYRSSLLGPEGWLPFWNCIGMIVLLTFVTAWIGIKRLTKQCDFI